MTPKERLMETLFGTEGRKHINIKFCRGSSGDISPEDLCAEANSVMMQIEGDMAETRDSFGDKGSPKIDVKTMS